MYSPATLVAGTTATVRSGFSRLRPAVEAAELPQAAASPVSAITTQLKAIQRRIRVTGTKEGAAGAQGIEGSPSSVIIASEAR
jgi:hypothetical protein